MLRDKHRLTLAAALAVATHFALTSAALADNCSGPLDCEQTAGYNGTIAVLTSVIAILTAIFGVGIAQTIAGLFPGLFGPGLGGPGASGPGTTPPTPPPPADPPTTVESGQDAIDSIIDSIGSRTPPVMVGRDGTRHILPPGPDDDWYGDGSGGVGWPGNIHGIAHGPTHTVEVYDPRIGGWREVEVLDPDGVAIIRDWPQPPGDPVQQWWPRSEDPADAVTPDQVAGDLSNIGLGTPVQGADGNQYIPDPENTPDNVGMTGWSTTEVEVPVDPSDPSQGTRTVRVIDPNAPIVVEHWPAPSAPGPGPVTPPPGGGPPPAGGPPTPTPAPDASSGTPPLAGATPPDATSAGPTDTSTSPPDAPSVGPSDTTTAPPGADPPDAPPAPADPGAVPDSPPVDAESSGPTDTTTPTSAEPLDTSTPPAPIEPDSIGPSDPPAPPVDSDSVGPTAPTTPTSVDPSDATTDPADTAPPPAAETPEPESTGPGDPPAEPTPPPVEADPPLPDDEIVAPPAESTEPTTPTPAEAEEPPGTEPAPPEAPPPADTPAAEPLEGDSESGPDTVEGPPSADAPDDAPDETGAATEPAPPDGEPRGGLLGRLEPGQQEAAIQAFDELLPQVQGMSPDEVEQFVGGLLSDPEFESVRSQLSGYSALVDAARTGYNGASLADSFGFGSGNSADQFVDQVANFTGLDPDRAREILELDGAQWEAIKRALNSSP